MSTSMFHFAVFVYILLFAIFFKQGHYLHHEKEEPSIFEQTAFPTYLAEDAGYSKTSRKEKKKTKKMKKEATFSIDF